MTLPIFSHPSSAVYVSEPYLKLLNKILFDLLGRKYGFQKLEYYYLHHVMKGTDHQPILLEMAEIILDSMPTINEMAVCFQNC